MGRTFWKIFIGSRFERKCCHNSKRGGLPETISQPIFLKRLLRKIFKEIQKLILDKKYLERKQLHNFKNPLHLINDNTKIMDIDRTKALKPIKKFNINLNKKLKILHVYNRAEKIGGRIYFISTGKKLKMV